MDTSKLIGALFLSFCLSGAGVCAYLLYLDINSASRGSNYAQAGVILFKTNSVQRKSPDLLIWNRLDAKDKVYWYDTVQTEPDSSAVLYIQKGIFLKLAGSSLIQLDRNNNQLALNLQSGQLDADFTKLPSGTNILINGNNMSQALGTGKKASFAVEGKNLTTFRQNADGTTTKFKMPLGSKTFSEETVPMSLLFPASSAQLNMVKAPLPFVWNSRKGVPIVIEVSKDAGFKSLAARKIVKGNTANIPLALGKYFWRIRAVEDKRLFASEVRNFSLVQSGGLSIYDELKNLKNALRGGFAEPPLERKVASVEPTTVAAPKAPKLKPVAKKAPVRKVAAVEPDTWTVRVAVYFQEDLASQKVNELREKGFSPYYEPSQGGYAVNVGLFISTKEATAFLTKLKTKVPDLTAAMIVKTEN